MTKSLSWKSDYHKKFEWSVANNRLHGKKNGTKLGKSNKGIITKKYRYYDGKNHRLTHSYILIDGQIFALDSGRILGSGATAKVKLAENAHGECFAVKIGSSIDLDMHERDVLKDIGRLKGDATRLNKHGQRKRYLVLPYLGVRLSKYRFRCDAERIDIGLQLIEQVNNLNRGHESSEGKKYIHNDIKPKNIVISKQGKLSLIDFGGAVEQGEFSRYITPAYLAPEIFRRKELPNPQSDTYSLGKTLREILPHNSWLQHTAALMSSINVSNRPFKIILIIVYLAEIHKHDDSALSKALLSKNYCYSPIQARALSALLLASNPGNNLATNTNLKLILENPHVAYALNTVFQYIRASYDGKNMLNQWKRKTEGIQFIRNLMRNKNQDLLSIRQEMSHWAHGYGIFAHRSTASQQSRAKYISQSVIFSDDHDNNIDNDLHSQLS